MQAWHAVSWQQCATQLMVWCKQQQSHALTTMQLSCSVSCWPRAALREMCRLAAATLISAAVCRSCSDTAGIHLTVPALSDYNKKAVLLWGMHACFALDIRAQTKGAHAH